MSIEGQFNLIAEEYDANRRKFIPCFDDFYIGTTEFIVSHISEPKRIIDLGAGTGLLTGFWHPHFPNAEYLLVDVAKDMLDVAKKRFDGMGNISYQVRNYIDKFPDTPFDAVISALSIHHLEDEEKIKLFREIHAGLPDGGVFVNYDQFCAGQAEINTWFDSHWERYLTNGGLTDEDIALWRERRKLDRECSVEWEVERLAACQFKMVKCVYSCQKFSVIVAVK